MVLLSMASLLGLASVTGLGAAPAPDYPSFGSAPLAASFSPKDKGDYKDQDIASLTAIVGQRSLKKSDWDPVQDQFTVGLEFDSYRPDDWVGVEAGFYYSKDKSQGAFGQMTEFSLGVRKTFSIGQTALHPYLGAGASFDWVTIGVDGTAGGFPGLFIGDSDETLGVYAHGGIFYTIARVNIGVDIRTLQGTSVKLAGVNGDANYVQYAATIGYGF